MFEICKELTLKVPDKINILYFELWQQGATLPQLRAPSNTSLYCVHQRLLLSTTFSEIVA